MKTSVFFLLFSLQLLLLSLPSFVLMSLLSSLIILFFLYSCHSFFFAVFLGVSLFCFHFFHYFYFSFLYFSCLSCLFLFNPLFEVAFNCFGPTFEAFIVKLWALIIEKGPFLHETVLNFVPERLILFNLLDFAFSTLIFFKIQDF